VQSPTRVVLDRNTRNSYPVRSDRTVHDKVVEFVPPERSETLFLLKVQANPVAGETTEENVTDPLNPYKPASVKLATPYHPE